MNWMYAAAFFALYTLAGTAHADERGLWGQPDQRTILMGTIGDDLRIMVDLSIHDTQSDEDTETTIRGHYVYQHVGVPIALTGRRIRRDGDRTLELTEMVESETTGTWAIHFDRPFEDNEFGRPHWLGTWTSADGERTLGIELEVVAEYDLGRRSIGAVTVEWGFPIPLCDTPMRHAMEEVYAEHRERLDNYVTDLQLHDEVPLPHRFVDLTYWDKTSATTTYWDEGIISVLFEQYTYGGGAHSNSFFHTALLVLRDGAYKQLELADIFLDPQDVEQVLSPLVVDKLIEQGWDHRMPHRAERVFSAEDMHHFTVSANGLTVYFEPYAIASYAEGPFVVTVAWEDLSEVIDPEGALGRWVE